MLYGRSMNIIPSLAWFYSLRVKALFCLSANLQQTLLQGDGICWKSLVPASGNFKFTDTLMQSALIEQVKNLSVSFVPWDFLSKKSWKTRNIAITTLLLSLPSQCLKVPWYLSSVAIKRCQQFPSTISPDYPDTRENFFLSCTTLENLLGNTSLLKA